MKSGIKEKDEKKKDISEKKKDRKAEEKKDHVQTERVNIQNAESATTISDDSNKAKNEQAGEGKDSCR